MKRYGFTLVELMGVIIILGVIALIAIPIVDRQLKESKNDLHQTQKENIKEAAKLWTAKNIYNLPASGEACYIKYSDLVNGGFLDEELKDPKTNTTFTDENINIKIEKDNDYNKYTYDVTSTKDDSIPYCQITVSFYDGETKLDSKTVVYHSTYGDLPTPTKEGYTFLGWTIKDYQFVDYIESTGTQHINTDIYPTSSTNMELDFKYLGAGTTAWVPICGERSSTSSTYLNFFINASSKKISPNYAGFDPANNSGFDAITIGNMYNLKNVGGKFYLNNELKDSTQNVLVSGTTPIYIFAIGSGNGVDNRQIHMQLYSFKIFDNNNIVMDLKPCYRISDSVRGLYDNISGKFFTNISGTGDDFSYGDSVYINDSYNVAIGQNHALTAVWQKND